MTRSILLDKSLLGDLTSPRVDTIVHFEALRADRACNLHAGALQLHKFQPWYRDSTITLGDMPSDAGIILSNHS